jgi:hypothetical protein
MRLELVAPAGMFPPQPSACPTLQVRCHVDAAVLARASLPADEQDAQIVASWIDVAALLMVALSPSWGFKRAFQDQRRGQRGWGARKIDSVG